MGLRGGCSCGHCRYLNVCFCCDGSLKPGPSRLSPSSRNVSKHGREYTRPKAKPMSNCVSCKQQFVVGLLQSGWKEKLWVGKIATPASQEGGGQVKLCSGFVCQPSAKSKKFYKRLSYLYPTALGVLGVLGIHGVLWGAFGAGYIG